MLSLSRRAARCVALVAQMLADPPADVPSKPALQAIVDRLACIQIDTIHVVARSQYIIPWSRIGHYDTRWLDDLLYPDRELFEYWGHAASLIDARLYPYFLRRMENYRARSSADSDGWAAENAELIEQVYNRVADEGPLMSASFERPDPDVPVETWAWWGGKPANRALDLLWSWGRLSIQRRVNFHRVYDLSDRVHVERQSRELPPVEIERHVLASRALQAVGVISSRWLNDYFRTNWGSPAGGPPGPVAVLDHLVAAGEAVIVDVEDLGPCYLSTRYTGILDDIRNGYEPMHTTLLSPFDNLIWDRTRTLALFDYEYRLECYTPAAKRRFGYFCLPILHRGRLIGRLDPKVERKDGVLFVRALHLEPDVRIDDRIVDEVSRAIRNFAAFNGADEIVIERGPGAFSEALTTA
jgi:uncharacterized protein